MSLTHSEEPWDGQLKFQIFDRWKQYVKLRKTVGFLLKNIENRL